MTQRGTTATHANCPFVTRTEMIEILRAAVQASGMSLRKLGAQWQVDFHEISKVLHEEMYPSDRLLRELGLVEESPRMYRRLSAGVRTGVSVSK